MHVAYACVYDFLAAFFKSMYVPDEVQDSLGSSMEGTFVSRGSLACDELSPGKEVISRESSTVDIQRKDSKTPLSQGRVVGMCRGKEVPNMLLRGTEIEQSGILTQDIVWSACVLFKSDKSFQAEHVGTMR